MGEGEDEGEIEINHLSLVTVLKDKFYVGRKALNCFSHSQNAFLERR